MTQFRIGDALMPKEGFVVSFIDDGDYNIELDDLPHSTIIDHFDDVVKVIESHILVQIRCQAGESRSCTLLAAILMKTQAISSAEALSRVKEIRPQVQINTGFHYQLQLYEEMNYEIDLLHPKYRKFKAWSLSCTREASSQFTDQFEEDPIHTTQPHLRCGHCRRKLVIYNPEINHVQCTKSYLVPPTQWMQASDLQGKLHCPRCKHKVGAYMWQGRPCQCNEYIAPYFSLSASKVDLMHQTR